MNEKFMEGMAEILELDEVTTDTSLTSEDVDWDSLAIISTIALTDTTYRKAISGEKLQSCQTVGDVVSLIAES